MKIIIVDHLLVILSLTLQIALLTESLLNHVIRRGKPALRKPKVNLDYYIETDSYKLTQDPKFKNVQHFENEYIIKNGSDFVLTSNVNGVQFVCEAAHPVMWTMPHPEQFSGMASWQMHINAERTSFFSRKLKEPRNQIFYAYLQIQSYYIRGASQTGHLSCQLVEHPDIETTIYVYSEGRNLIENSGSVQTVKVENSSHIIIPCRPVLPELQMSLSKLVSPGGTNLSTLLLPNQWLNGTKWNPLSLSSSITYDPKTGFQLDTKQLPDVIGYYKCTISGETEESEDDVVAMKENFKIVKVEKGEELPSTFEFEPKVHLKSRTAKFVVNRQVLECCSGNKLKPATGYNINCENEAECDFYKPLLVHDALVGKGRIRSIVNDCYKVSIVPHQSKIVICNGENIDVAAHFVSASNTKDNSPFNNYQLSRMKSKLYDVSSNISSDYLIKFSFYIPRGYYYVLADHPNYRKHPSYLDRISLQPPRAIDPRLRPHAFPASMIGGYGGIWRNDWTYVRTTLNVPLTRDMFEGEAIVVSCAAHVFRYAKGSWLQLNWKNGSRNAFKLISNSINPSLWSNPDLFETVHYGMIRTEFVTTSLLDHSVVGRINALDLEMKSIDCFAPVWNSNEWEKRSFELRIKNSTLPTFENPSEETLTVTLNDTNVIINCSLVPISQNLVLPVVITWRKDGKLLDSFKNGIGNITSISSANVTNSTLHLFQISHEMQGEFECVAKNMKGEVTKIFKVFVDDGKGNTIKVIAITLICICLCAISGIFALSWSHWSLRNKIAKLLLLRGSI